MRISENILYQTIPTSRIRISKAVEKTIMLWILDLVSKVPFLFVAERFAIGNQKLKVPCVRLIYMRVIDLVDDTMAKREPDATAGMVGGADSLLRTRSPPWRRSWRAKPHGISLGDTEIEKVTIVHVIGSFSPPFLRARFRIAEAILAKTI